MTEALLEDSSEAAARVLGQLTSTDNTAATTAVTEPHSLMTQFKDLNGRADTESDNTDRIIDVTQDLDDGLLDKDDGVYEPLESPVIAPVVATPMATAAAAAPGSTSAAGSLSDPTSLVISKLLYLSSKLSYHVVSFSSVWQDGALLSSLEKCLTALRQHPQFLELLPAADAVCSVLHDRCVHSGNSVEFETAMGALVNGLGLTKDAKLAAEKEKSAAAVLVGLKTTASLSSRLPQGPSRRKLWTQIDEFWLQLAAGVLEQKETQWRQQKKKEKEINQSDTTTSAASEEDIQIIAISSLITEFYILDAPVVVKIDKIHDVLLSTGLFRGLILSFIKFGRERALESLRRTLLICCSAFTGLLTWAKAVPGFSTAWEYPEFREDGSLERYGAVHAAVFGLAGGDEALARVLLLGDTGGKILQAENVPEVYVTLQLIESVQKAKDRAGRGGKGETVSFLSGSVTAAALESLSSSLRALKVDLDDTKDQDTRRDESEEAEKAREEEKLALSSEEQAGRLAARRAKLLQPECLRLIKGLRAKPGSVGKSD
jgi:hypothetical protein